MDFPSDTVGYVGGDNGTVLKFSGTPNGISENIIFSEINFFPNPAKGSTQINNIDPGCKIILENLSGQTVKSETAENNSEKINLENISPGIYFIRIESENQTVVRKLIVE